MATDIAFSLAALVLGLGIIRSDGHYLGTPRGDTEVKPLETLILYGRNADIARLDRRKKGPGGNIQHAEAVAAQKIKKKDIEKVESSEMPVFGATPVNWPSRCSAVSDPPAATKAWPGLKFPLSGDIQ